MTSSRTLVCSAFVAALTVSACNRDPANKQIEPVYDKQTGKLQVLKYDRDKNGTAETISFMDGSRILRAEIDENEDGKVDRWEHYDANQKLVKVGTSRTGNGKEDSWSYPADDGSVAKIEISSRADGKVTRTEFYEKAAIVRAEEDSDGDGVLDKWEAYATGGQLASVAFDTSHRGTPDRRLVYGTGGAARVENDSVNLSSREGPLMMKFRGKLGLIAVVVAVLWRSGTAAAQQRTAGAPDPEKVPMRVGPVWVKPTMALTNFGVDTNLFNKPDAEGPQEDFNITIAPAVNLWLPVGSTWINGTIRENLIWYQKHESENSANTSMTAGWTGPLTRTTFSLGGNWLRTHERPGFEIDARADRTDFTYQGVVEYRTLARTFVGLRAERRNHDYAEGQEYENQDLREELKRKETLLAATFRHELTPLTSLTIDAGHDRDRFDLSPERDADSNLALVGLSFAADALLNGSIRVGYRNYNPLSSAVPDYNGMIMSANVSYAARDTTRVSLQTTRDVQYSYDEKQPYYVLTGFNASVIQRLFGPFDAEGRLGRQQLAYKNREGADLVVVDRVDHVQIYGGGLGFNMREEMRLGFNIDYQSRASELPERNYSGFRFGMTASYGL